MKKLLTSLAIAAASCVAATSAHALVLVLDNFNAPTPGVTIADWDGLENNDNSTADGSLADNVTTAGISAFVTSRNIRHIVDDAALIAARPTEHGQQRRRGLASAGSLDARPDRGVWPGLDLDRHQDEQPRHDLGFGAELC
jgi:hypothetical protein